MPDDITIQWENMKELWGAVPREGKSDLWTRIGTAFPNRDGSYNLRFNFVPTDPRTTIQLRHPKGDASE